MKSISIADFSDGGLIREASFCVRVNQMDIESFRDEDVLVSSCGSVPIPTWAAMMIAARLAQVAKSIAYGDEDQPIVLFDRDAEHKTQIPS